MRKNAKKSLLGILCASLVVCTATAVTVASAEETQEPIVLPSFQMTTGASIRKSTNGTTGNGIRFSATFDDTDKAKLADYKVTAGTFIMPESYLSAYGEINEANCFTDATTGYWWKGKAGDETKDSAQKEILHVVGNVYQDSASGLNKFNGSVIDILEENLDKNYVGVSYLKAEKDGTTQYFFAEREASNYRSPMAVAVNILASQTSTAAEKSVATVYANTYLTSKGGTVNCTIKKDVYVNSSAGYSKDLNKSTSQTITITDVDGFATALNDINTPVFDGYVLVTGSDAAKSSASLNLSGVTNFKYYYDKTDKSNVIFDSSIKAAGKSVFEANGFTTKNAGVYLPEGRYNLNETTEWGWHGDGAILVDDWWNQWATLEFETPKLLPAATDKISMMIKNVKVQQFHPTSGNEDRETPIEIHDGTGWVAASYKLNYTTTDAYEVTLTLKRPVTQVGKLSFCVHDQHYYQSGNGAKNTRSIYYIDYIHAEYDVLSGADANLVATQDNQAFSFGLPITSTVYSDAELNASLSKASVTAQKLASTETATALNAVNGKYSLTVAKETNYAINYALTLGGNTVSGTFYALGYYKNMVDDYESYALDTVLASHYKIVANSIDNGNALKLIDNIDAWPRYDVNVTLDGSYTTVCMWIYSPSAKTFEAGLCFELWDQDNKWQCPTSGFSVNVGWNYIEVEMRKAFTGVLGVDTNPRYWPTGAMIDRIAFKTN